LFAIPAAYGSNRSSASGHCLRIRENNEIILTHIIDEARLIKWWDDR
jgi:hypothetical protein